MGLVRKPQLRSLLVDRYISVLHITSDTEREEVKGMLYKDEALMSTVDRIMDITKNSQRGTWASFLGFREVRQGVTNYKLGEFPTLLRLSWCWRTFPCSTRPRGFSGGCSGSTTGESETVGRQWGETKEQSEKYSSLGKQQMRWNLEV